MVSRVNEQPINSQQAGSPAPVRALPVLSYEKPLVYRYESDLPPPGVGVKLFWAACYRAGRLLGKVYKPRPAPRLYTPKPDGTFNHP